ncbi:LacI family DNA-binding transcriptional regulator [Rhodoferax mekongensis]|uniref:LacI family DNA-binding transcriptional regulator n=1 Tax=Rhodoferax mekongensis TaxID=3068341 RepID=UPI0028BDBC36|nr:LacI family DNA-binding transcriptional regulator [Rhodoferax sp. TBRC 17199]MDT7517092.1 LacI family DNA-binding transcriptional regulator [Rhodoferax sp. TBRC 17199]
MPKASPVPHPTSRDVAEKAGVSRTQVSYVFSDSKSKHVSAEKRDRILAAAQALGYKPHQFAQTLRKGYSNEFGLFFPAPYTPRINSMLAVIHEKGLTGHCVPAQYSFNSYSDAERKREAFAAMLSRRPVGFFCSLLDLSEEDIQYARNKGVDKILVLDLEPHPVIPTLDLPVEQVGYLAARHLLELGHRRIAIVEPADPIQAKGFKLRMRGVGRAAASYPGVKLISMRWLSSEIRPTYKGAEQWIQNNLKKSKEPMDAVYAYSDDYAFPLLAALIDAGFNVPDDISILGTDDHFHAQLFRPALTTVSFDSVHIGERAVEMINQLLLGTDFQPIPTEGPRLIIRSTTCTKKS